ncbi:transcriptional regulator with XRE-family HTH domain [Kibdelosporangium banguiense]|uniref:Transcriptional regulator with XRE-family HTH domain n=1 Tax=Kibdelosporangium banguiense TaxID=1365924 RepID=A0ABS4TG91_9PSEU|nr:helix-turn-helix transcriptional regulator [Kibdelosporangium banguiense]MBP2323444.1 transcriptional regulator with XRE-family HTH domain [Kibdelosporangium banguiense]
MPRKSPGAKAKGLGTELRILRERAKKKQADAARALGVSVQVISRLETGNRNISEEEVLVLLTVYEVAIASPKREQLLMMARTLNDPGWWEHDMPGLTQESATLADYEERARRITSWAPLLIPGLLQTMSYSRAYMLDDGIAPSEVEGRLTTRLRRQHRLTRSDVQYVAIIGEPALSGLDPALAAEQYASLLAASARPNISIRVVPIGRLKHAGRLGGFLALELENEEPVVHVELARSGVFLDEPSLTGPYFDTLAGVSEVALSETESSQWISHRKGEMES